ncbi:RnfABCDGE type electron transport complex subunit D [Exilibacterium tricleocarpae]|uniref:Ion-translocating oxidoreductase complex subunit D n=1 Tax=Exilibacterium tricleocarpae TaxID=2591008 RepID=A0A545U9Q3_9GAMM|nr:RnfABCDGE type electron transport complex subunit D [Exilibacterium tricleocarpae]TQV86143.1 RnfABCDGE type electron transport complex subunit D [Exilibacterium tricleocarpae]
MNDLRKTLEISTSPHIASGRSVEDIMRNVVWALLPATAFAIYAFGIGALLTLSVATLTCVATEHLLCRGGGRRSTVGDWSAVVTGLLYGLTLPPGLPLWMVVGGGVVALALGKYLFGGLGYNAFNPALVGRAFLQAAFPAAMTTWTPALAPERFQVLPSSTLTLPFMTPDYSLTAADGVTGATPLALMKFDQQPTGTYDLAFGFTGGSMGETCGVLILLGGIWLVARKMMNWRIPAAIFGTVIILSALFNGLDPARYPGPWFTLFSGGLMLGAVFMATDMVASPMTSLGVVIYGIVIGALIIVIRFWGGMPEGVMYAILLGNALSPHIDALTQPRVFGYKSGLKSERYHEDYRQ